MNVTPKTFMVNAYSPSLERIQEILKQLKERNPNAALELWEIWPDTYGNKYVIITRGRFKGRPATVDLKKRIQ